MAFSFSVLGGQPLSAPGLAAYRRPCRDKLVVTAQADKLERWRPQGDRSYSSGKDARTSPDRSSTRPERPNRPDYRGDRPYSNNNNDNSKRPRWPKTIVSESGIKLKQYVASDGQEHLGSAIQRRRFKPFPGPPGDEGPPLRILPIGGLGEIGMNCMLAGVRDRFIVIDAGLMFPDFSDLGMQKILPDTDFLAQWKDRIEALIITHGHEDHIGALPWVVPALDPKTPIYAAPFVMELIKRRLTEYNLWDENRFIKFEMRQRFQAGPFEIEPVRVTHSIPDCCGLIMRSSEGTIVHTGDWKIDENPLDGERFDRELFEALGSEPVALMMSDSTNVLSPGRTLSETVVHDSIVEKVLAHNGKGRVICTQFASNLHRLYGVKRAADASGRRICFVGASLSHYLEAAWRDKRAPFDPRELMQPEELRHANPNEVLIVTTGSQGEPRAQLAMAARDQSKMLKVLPNDLLLYSAKVIPGNEGKVTKMLNALAEKGARVRQSRADNLHTSGHAYQEELVEVLQSVRPQHFLPVHGEYAFLTEHALLARERAGINFVDVIRNGEMLAVRERRNRNTVSTGSMAAAQMVAGRGDDDDYPGVTMVKFDGEEPEYFFNDGGKGTGNREEMEIDVRSVMALEGVVVVGVDVMRPGAGQGNLSCRVKVTTRALWTDGGRLLGELTQAVESALVRQPGTVSLVEVERTAIDAVKRRCVAFNNKRPEVIAIAYEHDPRDAHLAEVAQARAEAARRADEARSGAGARDAAGGSGTLAPALRRGRPNPWEAGAPGSAVRPAAPRAADGPPGVLAPGAARRTRLPMPGASQQDAEEQEAPPAAASRGAASRSFRVSESRRVVDEEEEEEEDGLLVSEPRDGSDGEADVEAEAEAPAPAARKRARSRRAIASVEVPAEEAAQEEGDGTAEGSSVADEGTTLSRMLRARKAAASSRLKASTKEAAAAATAEPAGPPPLRKLDPEVIRDRRRRNPRDQPAELDDPDYG